MGVYIGTGDKVSKGINVTEGDNMSIGNKVKHNVNVNQHTSKYCVQFLQSICETPGLVFIK